MCIRDSPLPRSDIAIWQSLPSSYPVPTRLFYLTKGTIGSDAFNSFIFCTTLQSNNFFFFFLFNLLQWHCSTRINTKCAINISEKRYWQNPWLVSYYAGFLTVDVLGSSVCVCGKTEERDTGNLGQINDVSLNVKVFKAEFVKYWLILLVHPKQGNRCVKSCTFNV